MGFKIFSFYQEASTYTKPNPAALQRAGADADRHGAYHRTIVRVSLAFGAVGFALGVVIWILALTGARPGNIKTEREAIGMLLSPVIFAMPGLLIGVAVSCLFAPREFLLGPVGQKWMKLIGTQSVTMARVVCCLVALVLGGVPLGLVLLIWLKS